MGKRGYIIPVSHSWSGRHPPCRISLMRTLNPELHRQSSSPILPFASVLRDGMRVLESELPAIAEGAKPPKSCVPLSHPRGRSSDDDLCPRSVVAANRLVAEWTAFFGDSEPRSDRLLCDFRAHFPHSVAGPVGARDHCRPCEAGRAPAPGSGRSDTPARSAAGLSALI